MTMTEALTSEAIDQLRAQVRADVLRPGEDGYDTARRIWNGMIDHHPGAIIRCLGAADVMAAVRFAAEHGIELSVKGGGHNVAGKAVTDGGLMIDLSLMRTVRVDPAAQRAQVGPGATLGDFDHEAQAHGLASTGGIDSRTGIAGLTLGGGIGFLARTHGLAADNLVAADVVTADGTLVRASERDNPDLFWALRGGGGNFGVVTNFEFQLHELGPDLMVAQAFHHLADLGDVLRFHRDLMDGAPDRLACYAIPLHLPPVEPFPPHLHGEPGVALVACYAGALDDGRAALEPVAAFGDPIVAAVEPMPYAQLQQSFDAGTPDGARYYFKAHMLRELSDGAIDAMVEHIGALPGSLSMVAIEPLGGAVGRVPADATAWPHREARFNFGIFAGWEDPADDDEVIAWARGLHDAVAPHATGGAYVNYLDRDDTDRQGAAFGSHYERLAEVKRRWDPQNLFRGNQNIAP